MIALPAYLGGEFEVAGIKWIASFPGNHALGLERASAIVVLNSTETGRPKAILEGSIISATRTAASAALAAQTIHGARNEATTGIIGCGAISFEVIRFLRAVYPEADDFVIFDIDVTRAREFRSKCLKTFDGIEIKIVEDLSLVLKEAPLVCIATTALKPHVFKLSECAPHSTILHISLRDLSPEVILSSDNVTDDIEHACRAETSLHLAERLVGDRDFIRCRLADILSGDACPRRDLNSVAVFSPFGLGVLDLAVAKLVYDAALEQGVGTVIDSFLTGNGEQ
jgi:ornithine cyclodeaminase